MVALVSELDESVFPVHAWDYLCPITSNDDSQISGIGIEHFPGAPVHGIVHVSKSNGDAHIANAKTFFDMLSYFKQQHRHTQGENAIVSRHISS
jgi:hypothetical protein